MRQLLDQLVTHGDARIKLPQARQLANNAEALLRCEDFWICRSLLRREDTEPDALDFVALAPEPGEQLQVARTLHHLRCDRTMDGKVTALDIVQNALVGCWFAACIVLWLQAINRDDNR